VAVRNLTLDVSRGEVFGFLGPNGAGKSTSVKMLLGLVFPTSGETEILGRPAGDGLSSIAYSWMIPNRKQTRILIS